LRARSSAPAVLYATRADDPVAHLEDCEDEERLASALGKLDETTRMAVVLRYYEEMTSKQIGALLDLPSTAIDMRLMRARQALRRELTGDEPRET
jgi:RNA polymerase sigma-70 factor (ECF subfamily)